MKYLGSLIISSSPPAATFINSPLFLSVYLKCFSKPSYFKTTHLSASLLLNGFIKISYASVFAFSEAELLTEMKT